MIVQIQYLRAAAALLVVFYHLSYRLDSLSSGRGADWALLGTVGVEIFFVVSGFIMWLTTAGRQVGPARFLAKRIARIVPLYWAMTLFAATIMLCAPRLLHGAGFDPVQLATSLAFVAWPRAGDPGTLAPIVFTGWTLNYEMFFYAVLGLFLLVDGRWRLLGLAGALGGLVAVGAMVPGSVPVVAFYTAPILLEFVFGMMLAAFYVAIPRIDPRIALVALAIAAAVLVAGVGARSVDRVITFGLPAVLVVFGVLYAKGGRMVGVARLPLLLGEASYAIYLSQVFPLAGFPILWRAAGLPGGGAWDIAFLLIGMMVVILFGLAVHAWVEKPLARLVRSGGVASRRRRHGPSWSGAATRLPRRSDGARDRATAAGVPPSI